VTGSVTFAPFTSRIDWLGRDPLKLNLPSGSRTTPGRRGNASWKRSVARGRSESFSTSSVSGGATSASSTTTGETARISMVSEYLGRERKRSRRVS
jgi:hypothetical protein